VLQCVLQYMMQFFVLCELLVLQRYDGIRATSSYRCCVLQCALQCVLQCVLQYVLQCVLHCELLCVARWDSVPATSSHRCCVWVGAS